MTRLALPMLVLAAGCTVRVPDHGVFVGNPGSARIRAAYAEDLEITEITLADGTLLPVDCDGGDGPPISLQDVDQDVGIDFPEGSWCGLNFALALDTFVLAESDQGGLLTLPLDIPRIDLVDPNGLDLQSQTWLIEIGEPGWFSAEDFGVEGEDVLADPHSDTAEALALTAASRSGMYADLDRNGEIDDDERAAGPAMRVAGR